MKSWGIDAVIAVVALGGWFALYTIVALATRPAAVEAREATADLGELPPSLVNLLVNRWRLTDEAVEATLLDLAARGHLELWQAGDDPRQTTLHVRDPDVGGLSTYEKRVLTRVTDLAAGGVLPVTALAQRDRRQAAKWKKRFREDVVADARARGLSRERLGGLLLLLFAGAFGVGVTLTFLAFRVCERSTYVDDPRLPFYIGIGGLVPLVVLANRLDGERDTDAAREPAGHWLGVRAWLRGHEEFTDLPPASVTVWGRYLAYAAAVGATRVTGTVLHLGMGDRRLVWSLHGGVWHQVRVRYPRLRWHLGGTTWQHGWKITVAAGVGALMLLIWYLGPSTELDALVWLLVSLILLGYGAYILVRAIIDLAVPPQRIAGEVLWVQLWRRRTRWLWLTPFSRKPRLYYLAVDDGSTDRTTAWGLPARMADRCAAGNSVTVTARRWSRRVVDLTVVGRDRASGESGGKPGVAPTNG
jgi:hypothetical protein